MKYPAAVWSIAIAAKRAWMHSNLPSWLNDETYPEKIQLCLVELTIPTISAAVSVSVPYATHISRGRRTLILMSTRPIRDVTERAYLQFFLV
jgi:hypothetical protein